MHIIAAGVLQAQSAAASSFVADEVVAPLAVHGIVGGSASGVGGRRATTYAPFVWLGGPVMHNVTIYAIYYGNWTAQSMQILNDMVRTSTFAVSPLDYRPSAATTVRI